MENLMEIRRLNWEQGKELAGSPAGPHIHEYEELLIGMRGEIEHFIDFKSSRLFAPFVSFVAQGKPHLVKFAGTDDQADLWMICFKSELIADTTFQLYSNYHNHADIMLQAGEKFNRISALCTMIHDEYTYDPCDYGILRQMVYTLFTMIDSERKKLEPAKVGLHTIHNISFETFLKILEENFRKQEGVDFYADKLYMSSRNLNRICQEALQKSVSEIIESRRLLEAKNLLIYTHKSISEIGYELGYNEKAYFTSVFKKKSGQTPTTFRKEMQKLIS